MALDKVGVNSLLAVNTWIGMINANMQGTSRTGFKPTRISLSDGLGQLYTTKTDLDLPPATLTVQASTMEWGQGSIVNSTESSHFAIQGEGFFVLSDSVHRMFLTRDGEFHWAPDGYLVNSAGLRVVSSGQSFIRRDQSDRSDDFSLDGYSKELLTYGDKSLMLVSVANRDGLQMSQYGSTVFQVDGDLPLRVQNDFTTTTDGLSFIYDDPDILPAVDDPDFLPVLAAPPAGYSTDFSIDFGSNGLMDFRNFNPLGLQDFDYTQNTIQHLITAINAYGVTVGGRVSASYEPTQDRILIRNEQDLAALVQNTQISFGGANGAAMTRFLRLNVNSVNNPIEDIDGDGDLETVLRSTRDLDNSTLAQYDALDINGPFYSVNDPIVALLTPVPTYTHNKATGFISSRNDGGNAGMVVGQSREVSEFELETNVKISTNDPDSRLVFGFGQKSPSNLSSSGFSLRYDPVTGNVTLFQQRPDYTDYAQYQVPPLPPPSPLQVAAATIAPMPAANAGALNLLANTARVAISLSSEKILTFSVNGSTATFNLGGTGSDINGYVSIRNSFSELELHSLNFDFKGKYNPLRAGDMFSVGMQTAASVEVKNAWQERQRSRVVQASLETSTASLTEYVPMLGLAQKVFAAVSKIISTYNALTDDLNTLFR